VITTNAVKANVSKNATWLQKNTCCRQKMFNPKTVLFTQTSTEEETFGYEAEVVIPHWLASIFT